jgi:hypothetical protein
MGTMSSASLTDAVAVDTEKWRMQHRVFTPETFFKWRHSEYFTSISILLVMEEFPATVPYSYRQKTSELVRSYGYLKICGDDC